MDLKTELKTNQVHVNLIKNFTAYLQNKGSSAVTIKNYLSDVRKFLEWKNHDQVSLTSKDFYDYRNYLKNEQKSKAVIKRYLSSVARFYAFLDIKLPASYISPENQGSITGKSKQSKYKAAKSVLVGMLALIAVIAIFLMMYPEKALKIGDLADLYTRKLVKSDDVKTSNKSYINEKSSSLGQNSVSSGAQDSKVLAEDVVIASQSNDFLSNSFSQYKLYGKRGEIIENYIDKYIFHGVAKLLEKAEVDFYEDINVLKKASFNTVEIENAKIKDLEIENDFINGGDAEFDDVLIEDLEITKTFQVGRFDSDPEGDEEGGLYFNTTNNQLYVNNGSGWNQVGTTYSVMTGGGLQLVNNQFGLLTCSANEILKYIGGVWACSTDSSGGGDFLSLTDTPSSYSGQGERLVRVGVGESSLEFLNASGWDQDSSDDLTTSNYASTLDAVYLNVGESASGGDVTGPFSNLQIASGVVGANEIASSGVTAGTYGAGSSIPVFTVDVDGRITSATNTVLDTSGITSVGVITSGSWQGAVIQVPFGGTGVSSFIANGVIFGNGTGPMQITSVPTGGQLLIGSSSSVPTFVSLSGDASLSSLGELTISDNSIDGTDIALGSDATGDLMYYNGADFARLAIGNSGNILTINASSQPIWATAASLTSGLYWSLSGNSGITASNLLGTTDTAPLYIGTSNQHRLTILGNGNVGIGTTNPTSTFDVVGTSNLGGLTISATGVITAGSWNGGTVGVAWGGTGFTTAPNGSLVYGTGGTAALSTLTIGSSNQILVSNGTVPTWGDASTVLGGSFWSLSGNSGITASNLLGTTDTAALYIGTSNQHRLTVLGNGNVGIGTTSPSEKLHLTDGTLLIDTPTNPIIVGSTVTTLARDVFVQGRYAYVSDWIAGIKIFDISSNTSPVLVGSLDTTAASSMYVSGKYAYVADVTNGVLVIDVSNPTNPTLVSTYATTTAVRVYLSGKYLYVANGGGGLLILDASNPASLVSVASTDTPGSAEGIYLSGKYAYVGDGTRGLAVFDISNVTSPILTGTVATTGNATDMIVSGKYAYVAAGTGGLNVVDISNPTSLSVVGTFNTNTTANDVSLSGKYAYVASNTFGMKIIDVSNNTSPQLTGSLDTEGTVFGITISGKYAYLADGTSGVHVVDIKGADISSLRAGNVLSNSIEVRENLEVGNNGYFRTGLNVGPGGILSNGPASIINTGVTVSINQPTLNVLSGSSNGALINIQTTSTGNYALDVQSANISRFYVRADGSIGVGTTTLTGLFNIGSGATSPFSVATGGELTLSGTGRHLRYANLSAEYPGAVLTNLYGTSTEPNTNGSMTSDLTSTGVGTSVAMPYYEWTSTQSTTQAYVVAVRVVLPQDFDNWNDDGSDDLTINYQTTDGTVGNNNFSVRIIGPTGSTGQYTGSLLASASWTTTTVDSASFGASGNTGWDAAGESAMIYLRLEAQNSNVARIGDIVLKYKSKW